jgi:hypothetical protein
MWIIEKLVNLGKIIIKNSPNTFSLNKIEKGQKEDIFLE